MTAKRKSKFGNVRPSGVSGMFQARYRGPDGRAYSKSGFPTETAAHSYLTQVQADILREVWRSPKAPPLPSERTLNEYAAEWMRLKQGEHRPSTKALYADLLRRHVIPALGRLTLEEVTPTVVRTWHHELRDKTGPTQVRQSYSVLRAILSTAVRDEILMRNPCQVVGAGQSRSAERPFMSREQAEAIAAKMPSDELRVLILLKFWACLRLGEVLALRRGDIGHEEGRKGLMVRVNKALVRVNSVMVEGEPKTKESIRIVPLPKQVEVLLRDYLAQDPLSLPSAYLFSGPRGRHLKQYEVRVPFHRAQEALGLSGYHLHDLRHAGLTHAALHGATLGQLKSRAGHNSARMVAHYQRQAAELDDRLADAMSDPQEGEEGLAQGS